MSSSPPIGSFRHIKSTEPTAHVHSTKAGILIHSVESKFCEAIKELNQRALINNWKGMVCVPYKEHHKSDKLGDEFQLFKSYHVLIVNEIPHDSISKVRSVNNVFIYLGKVFPFLKGEEDFKEMIAKNDVYSGEDVYNHWLDVFKIQMTFINNNTLKILNKMEEINNKFSVYSNDCFEVVDDFVDLGCIIDNFDDFKYLVDGTLPESVHY